MNIVKFTILSIVVSALTLSPSSVRGQESLNPQGYEIDIQYQFTVIEALGYRIITVKWTISNNEDFDISGLYFAENLPPVLSVERFSLSIDHMPIESYYSGPRPNQTIHGYNTHRWVIDFPGDSGNINNILEPGQTLRFDNVMITESHGRIILPFHTACFFGGGSGFFTVADTIIIPSVIPAIPALGEWGMIVLSLTLLGFATMMFIRSRQLLLVDGN